jgi:hypothetical protein
MERRATPPIAISGEWAPQHALALSKSGSVKV